jgi:hypothetical protein
MGPQAKTKSQDVFDLVSEYALSHHKADALSLRRMDRELDVLQRQGYADSLTYSAALILGTMHRDAAKVAAYLRAGRAALYQGAGECAFLLNAVFSLFNCAAFDEADALMRDVRGRWPQDIDVARVGSLCALLECRPFLAAEYQAVRLNAGSDTPNQRVIDVMKGVFERCGISDDQGAALARPLLAQMARHTHNLAGVEMSLRHVARDPEDGLEHLLVLYQPMVAEEHISAMLEGYADALGASGIELDSLRHLVLDIRDSALVDDRIAA